MTQVSGSNVLITGGASGIGRAMAKKMARKGANVVLWDFNPDGLNAVVEEIASVAGRRPHGFICDVSKRELVYDVAAKVKEQVGPIDILINNAGIVSGKPLLEVPDDKIEQTFRVNTLALFWTTKAFLPDMVQANRGHVVTIASAAGICSAAKLTDYSASKWAAVGFDEALRMELKTIAPGVRTTVVCPFYIDTGMFAGAKTRFPALLPILKEDEVAQRIVGSVEQNHPRLFMPPIVHLVPVLRGLPIAVFDTVAQILGINQSMDSFVGRASTD